MLRLGLPDRIHVAFADPLSMLMGFRSRLPSLQTALPYVLLLVVDALGLSSPSLQTPGSPPSLAAIPDKARIQCRYHSADGCKPRLPA